MNDASGQPVAYVYGEDSPQDACSQAMSVDEARSIAANVAAHPKYRNRSSRWTSGDPPADEPSEA
jgi:hypothetical protein